MFKNPLTALLLLLIPVSGLSQDFRFIVFTDPHLSWLKPEMRIIENAGIRGGFNVGFEMDNFFSENYAISTGLSIIGTGGKLKFNEPVTINFEGFSESVNPGDIVNYKLQYLNIPLGLKFTTREIGYSTIYAKLGVSGHFNIRASADISSLGIEEESLKEEIEFFNLSYHIGAGVQYSLGGQTAVVVGLEYNHRFIDIASSPDYKALLNTISLKLGILF
jgi:opacity protein-like surface antigen